MMLASRVASPKNAPVIARLLSVLRVAGLALAGLLLAYAAAGFLLGAIPANRGWRQADRGVLIFVETNGVHSGVLLPVRAAGVDWSRIVRPEHLPDPRRAGTHLLFGWGERRFYLETPRWSDVRPATVVRAATGSDETLIHVDHVRDPRSAAHIRPLRLSTVEYRRLARAVAAQFAPGGAPIAGYGPADVFYPARGRYDMVRTCNAWTGDMLRAAGVRVGRWTPFSATVMWWFDAPIESR